MSIANIGNTYQWVKTLHIVLVTSWFAGLFYLPRILVNLALVDQSAQASTAERERLLLMASKLYRFIGPIMVLALGFGFWLWLGEGIGKGQGWMHAKLGVVGILIVYHYWCGRELKRMLKTPSRRSHVWFRWFNELPVLLLLLVVALVVIRPF